MVSKEKKIHSKSIWNLILPSLNLPITKISNAFIGSNQYGLISLNVMGSGVLTVENPNSFGFVDVNV